MLSTAAPHSTLDPTRDGCRPAANATRTNGVPISARALHGSAIKAPRSENTPIAQAATSTSAARRALVPARLELGGELTDPSTTATPNSLTTCRILARTGASG